MAKKHEPKVPIAAQVNHKAGHHAGASILLELDRRFPAGCLEPMLDECVLATGELEFADLLKRFWLNGEAHDLTLAESKAIHRTSEPQVQLQIELIARGFLAAQVMVRSEPVAEEPREKVVRVVKLTHRCPCCWERSGGKIGKRNWQSQVNGPVVHRNYTCDQPDCGWKWTIEARSDESDGVIYVTEKVIKVFPPAEGADNGN